MKILVTGAKEFLGRNLCVQLKNIEDTVDIAGVNKMVWRKF